MNRLSARGKFHTAKLTDGKTILTYNNRVRILGTTMETMGGVIEDGELAMNALNGLPREYHGLISNLDPVEDTGKDFTS